MNKSYFLWICFTIMIGVVGFCFVQHKRCGYVVHAQTKKFSGVDSNGIGWKYNKKTKTLTFSGSGPMEDFIMDGHSAEPDWYIWQEEVEHVVIKKGITKVGEEACSGFTHVKSVYLSDTVTIIGSSAFFSCMRLQNINMSKNVTRIDDCAFSGCERLKQISIPKSTTYIGRSAFEFCESVTELKVPSNVKHIGRAAFGGCINLMKVTLPSRLKTIPEKLFIGCEKLKQIDIPQSVTTIYAGAFAETGIETLVIPKNVTKFKRGEVGEGVFKYCLNLTKIEIKSKKIEACFKHTFDDIWEDVVIEVPKSKCKEYKTMFRNSGLNKKVKIRDV